MKESPTGFSTMTSSIEFADNYNRWIIDRISYYLGKNFLEIGIGHSNFKGYLNNKYNKYISVDINAEVLKRAEFRDPGGLFYKVDIAEEKDIEKTEIKNHIVDTVICINVLEHIPNDKTALKNMENLLIIGGHIILFVPALMLLFGNMDKLAGHCKRYKKTDIYELINKMPLEVVVLEYFNPLGGLGWLINKFIKHKNLDSNNLNKQVKYFDKYAIPFSKVLNPITKNFFGQSIICVLKKTS